MVRLVQLTTTVLIALLPSAATAPRVDRETTPCQAIVQADVVFSGTVIDISQAPAEFDRDDVRSRAVRPPMMVTLLRIDETYFGPRLAEVRVLGRDGDRSEQFENGKRYLVYAALDAGEYAPPIGRSIRTVPLREASEDLAYLIGLDGRVAADVEGRMNRIDYDARYEGIVEPPIVGGTVVLDGEGKRFSARTGRDGSFSIRGVPAGRYRVSTTPSTERTSVVDSVVQVPERGCVKLWFLELSHGVVQGQVVDDTGTPAKGVTLALVPAGRLVKSGNFFLRDTDEEGRFRFEGMPAGRYQVGVEIVAPTYGTGDYGPLFYPRARERSGARTINLGREQTVDVGRLRLPPAIATRAVEGRVVYRGEQPHDRARIVMRNVRAIEGYDHEVDVASDGTFRAVALEGETYVVQAKAGARSSVPVRLKVEGHVDGLTFVLAP